MRFDDAKNAMTYLTYVMTTYVMRMFFFLMFDLTKKLTSLRWKQTQHVQKKNLKNHKCCSCFTTLWNDFDDMQLIFSVFYLNLWLTLNCTEVKYKRNISSILHNWIVFRNTSNLLRQIQNISISSKCLSCSNIFIKCNFILICV